MALKKINMEIDLGFGGVVTDSYVKVSRIDGTKDSILITVQFLSEDKSKLYKEQKYSFKPSLTDGNFIEQGYNYLKTLDTFSNSEDI